MVVGIVLFVLGIFQAQSGGHHEEAAHTEAVDSHGEEAAEASHAEGGSEGHHYSWTNRLFANLWINNVYFTGLAIIGVFFFALQ